MGMSMETAAPTVAQEMWTRPSLVPDLLTGDVHLWRFPLTATGAERDALVGLLDSGERARAERMRLAQVRTRFEVGHGRLRRVLAHYVDASAAEILIGAEEGGKPFVGAVYDARGLQFSLSHSGDVGLVGVTRGRAIGVDVEVHRSSVDMDLIARRQFAPGEVARLSRVSEDDRVVAFFTCWTRKEAYLKARGEGLIGRLQDFEVALLPGEPPEIRWAKSGAGERLRWEVIDVPVGDGVSGACVIERPIGEMRLWSLL